jgi:hypothetical protein
MNYAVIDQNGNIVNIIVYDGVSQYNPGEGLTLVQVPENTPAMIGGTYLNGTFSSGN